jgi:chorismate-pyruvate lyase
VTSSFSSESSIELGVLIALFYDEPQQLGAFQRVAAEEMPETYRTLLNHSNHMTVTVEQFYSQAVNVQVLRHRLTDDLYEREILLLGQVSGEVVQHGIVRLKPSLLRPEVWASIASRGTPLGRVLIENNVLRAVELHDLWQVQCGASLAGHFSCPLNTVTYGRTALLHCDGQPAIELLEIVAPTRQR